MIYIYTHRIARRGEYSRKRRGGGDVDFVTDRNKQFNRKIARAFDAFTAETKASLERGTALT